MTDGRVIVYVGDVGEYLSVIAINQDPLAKLIDSSNCKKLQSGVYYTSLGDLKDLNEFGAVLQQADEIIYAPPDSWSHIMAKTWTEDYLQICAADSNKKVVGCETDVDSLSNVCRELVAHRASETAQVWIAGCSISHGVGVNPAQRYGSIIAEQLGLSVTYLTLSSSSVCWAADQILRSDIRSGDKVFWGITSPHRLTYWNDIQHTVGRATLKTFAAHKKFLSTTIKENFLASNHVKYQSILAVRQVNNYCRKIKAELIMATLMPGLERYLKDLQNFTPLAGLYGRNVQDLYLDIGDDGLHPGIQSHKFFAERMVNKYRQLYEFKN